MCDVEYFCNLLRGTDSAIEEKIADWQTKCLECAASIVFESSLEIGRQLSVELPKEPFSESQQKRSRLDGGQNLDGTQRLLLPIVPPLTLAHVAHEEKRAKELNVQPRGTFDIPLTGRSHSIAPSYRLLHSFPLNDQDCAPKHPPGTVPFDPEQQSFLLPEGKVAPPTILLNDAEQWSRNFALDAFRLHVSWSCYFTFLQCASDILLGLCVCVCRQYDKFSQHCRIYIYVCVSLSIFICIYMYISIYICTCIYVYVYIYTFICIFLSNQIHGADSQVAESQRQKVSSFSINSVRWYIKQKKKME